MYFANPKFVSRNISSSDRYSPIEPCSRCLPRPTGLAEQHQDLCLKRPALPRCDRCIGEPHLQAHPVGHRQVDHQTRIPFESKHRPMKEEGTFYPVKPIGYYFHAFFVHIRNSDGGEVCKITSTHSIRFLLIVSTNPRTLEIFNSSKEELTWLSTAMIPHQLHRNECLVQGLEPWKTRRCRVWEPWCKLDACCKNSRCSSNFLSDFIETTGWRLWKISYRLLTHKPVNPAGSFQAIIVPWVKS